MSYKLCFFGVSPTSSMSDVLGQFAAMADELRLESGYQGVFLTTSSDDESRASGLRLLYLTALPAPRGRVPRDFFTERWEGPPLFVLVYDDQNGMFLWEHRPGGGVPRQSILTNGHRVGLSNIVPAVDYPQRAFTNAQLDAALRKPEQSLTRAEALALHEWHDAITIGFAHVGVKLARASCLDVLSAETTWSLLDKPPVLEPLPRDAGPVVSYYIERYDFMRHGLEPREY